MKVKFNYGGLRDAIKKAGKSLMDHKALENEITQAFKDDLRVQFDSDGAYEIGTYQIWSENTKEWDDHKAIAVGHRKKMMYSSKLIKNLLGRKVKVRKSGNIIHYIWEWWAKRDDFDYAEFYQNDGFKHPREFVITPSLMNKIESILVKNLEKEIAKL